MRLHFALLAVLTLSASCTAEPRDSATTVAESQQLPPSDVSPAFADNLINRAEAAKTKFALSISDRTLASRVKNIKTVPLEASDGKGCDTTSFIGRANQYGAQDEIEFCLHSALYFYSDVEFNMLNNLVRDDILAKYGRSYAENVSKVTIKKTKVDTTKLSNASISCGFIEFVYDREILNGSGVCVYSPERFEKSYSWALSKSGADYLSDINKINIVLNDIKLEQSISSSFEKWKFAYKFNQEKLLPNIYFELIDYIIFHEICHIIFDGGDKTSKSISQKEYDADLCALSGPKGEFLQDALTIGFTFVPSHILFISRQFYSDEDVSSSEYELIPSATEIATMNARVRGLADVMKSTYTSWREGSREKYYADHLARSKGFASFLDAVENQVWENRPDGLKAK